MSSYPGNISFYAAAESRTDAFMRENVQPTAANPYTMLQYKEKEVLDMTIAVCQQKRGLTPQELMAWGPYWSIVDTRDTKSLFEALGRTTGDKRTMALLAAMDDACRFLIRALQDNVDQYQYVNFYRNMISVGKAMDYCFVVAPRGALNASMLQALEAAAIKLSLIDIQTFSVSGYVMHKKVKKTLGWKKRDLMATAEKAEKVITSARRRGYLDVIFLYHLFAKRSGFDVTTRAYPQEVHEAIANLSNIKYEQEAKMRQEAIFMYGDDEEDDDEDEKEEQVHDAGMQDLSCLMETASLVDDISHAALEAYQAEVDILAKQVNGMGI